MTHIIPVLNMILLPGTTLHFKRTSLENMGVKEVSQEDTFIFRFRKERAPGANPEFYPVGAAGNVTEVDDEGTVSILVTDRVKITSVPQSDTVSEIHTEPLPDIEDMPEDAAIRFAALKDRLLDYIKQFEWGVVARGYLLQLTSMNQLACGLSSLLNVSNEEKYQILETDSQAARFDRIEKLIYEFVAESQVSGEAQLALQKRNEKFYREEALKKQIEFLQKQLDDMHPENITDVRRFEKAIAESGMNETARKEAEKVLRRMKLEGKDSHEYGMLYEYLDFVTNLSWKKEPFQSIRLDKAERILDEDHYGLKKVKKRIIQHLAVMALGRSQSGSILLFVGAPGTGKTSIGQSIAKALGRAYVRISLGGIRDEAEIRGHRRTYVGAMPGRIMDGMKKSGVSNPVIVLDEIDKLSQDYNGDPANALLEVLDPEQNNTFTDHYMNVPYDLSDVLFICTANSMDTIPAPLLDRMEIIQFPGYTPVEKEHIATRHLIPQAKKAMNIAERSLRITNAAVRSLIDNYTFESGVRGLKKQINTLCRAAAVSLVRGRTSQIVVLPRSLEKLLDQHPIHHAHMLEDKQPGVVTGLAWTAAGGEILFIETMLTPGSGKVIITGQLGDVMKESAQIAVSIVKHRYPDKAALFEQNDLHIHVPAGATPKDGPSAGITLTTALTSLVTGQTVSPTIAMTGEVSLRGGVMPIGGLPEKLMAAQRAGIGTVLIPAENQDDLHDIPTEVTKKLTIVPVKTVDDVLSRVLEDA